MRRVTRLLLVASFAAVGLTGMSACSDDVTVVEPPPPPPPPPPPVTEASVAITALRDFDTGADVTDDAVVEGKLIVFVDINAGENNRASSLDILVDGEEALNCQNFTTTGGDGEGSAVVVECILNTAAIEGECTGQVAEGAFPNGEHTIGARLTLEDGETVTAERGFPVEFNNPNTLIIEHLAGGQGVLGPEGRTFWGGPTDLVADDEDAEDNLLEFAACAVLFDTDLDVAEVRLAGETTAGGDHVDLTGGPGALATDDEEPFVFSATSDNNAGVEDDPTGSGHTIGTSFQVFNEAGGNITSQFDIQPLEMFFLDFQGPEVGAGAEIFIDGQAVVTNGLYSAGDFGLSGDVTDDGVGVDFDATVVEVHDAADPTTVEAEDAESIDDLSEDDGTVDGDTNELDAYEAEVTALLDLLSNPGDPSAIPTSDPFGADRTEPELSELRPETAEDDDPLFILNDDQLLFDASDPDLESGDPGSGVDLSGCGTLCTEITATIADDGQRAVQNAALDGDDINVNLDFDETGAADPLADGEYTITVDVPDQAVLLPNVGSGTFTFLLDRTPPDVQFSGVTGLDQSNAASVVLTVDGNVTDRSGDGTDVTDADMVVTLAGPNGVCDDPDPASGSDDIYDPAAVDVTPDETSGDGVVDVDLTEQVQGQEGDFEQEFVAQNQGGTNNTVRYCFWVVADDGALNNEGDDDGVTSEAFASKTFTWNP